MELKEIKYSFEPIIKRQSDGKKASLGVFFPWSTMQQDADGVITLQSMKTPSMFDAWAVAKNERTARLEPGFGERMMLGPGGWQDKKRIFAQVRDTNAAMLAFWNNRNPDTEKEFCHQVAEANEAINTKLYRVTITGGYSPYVFILQWPDVYTEGDAQHTEPGKSVHATNRLQHVGGNIYDKDYPRCMTANWYDAGKYSRHPDAGWLFDTLPDNRM